MKEVARGDAAAFRILFDLHRNRVYAIGFKLFKSEALAEDAVQEIFLKLWLNKAELPQVDNFPAYLNTLTRHHLLNHLKRLAQAEKFAEQQKRNEQLAPASTSDVVEWNELQATLSKAISRLTPQQKKVYYMGKNDGLTYKEIAGRLQISRETVKTHMSEALRSVKTFLLQFDSTLGRLFLTAFWLLKIFF